MASEVDELLVEVASLHRQAMEFSDQVVTCAKGDSRRDSLLRKAFNLEREAADRIAVCVGRSYDPSSYSPSLAILHRSAASLALECGEIEEAARLANVGLSGPEVPEISDELREILDQVRIPKDGANTPVIK